MSFTIGNRKALETERHKSAITDHVVKENHVMNGDSTKIIVNESDWKT